VKIEKGKSENPMNKHRTEVYKFPIFPVPSNPPSHYGSAPSIFSGRKKTGECHL